MSDYPDLYTWWLQLHFAIQLSALVLAGCVAYIAGVHWRRSRLWDRFVRAHGGDEVAAMGTVVVVEADFEWRIQRSAPKWRRGLLTDADQ